LQYQHETKAISPDAFGWDACMHLSLEIAFSGIILNCKILFRFLSFSTE